MSVFLLCCSIAILTTICWSDIKQRIISNKAVLLLLGITLPYTYLVNGNIFFFNAIITLFIGILLFKWHIIGAGDVKLLAVLMLAIPQQWITSFLFLISFFGLIIIIFGWLFFRHNIKTEGLPYGVAISLGYLSTLWLVA